LGTWDAPWAWKKHAMRFGHLPCALGISKVALGAPWACPMRPEHLKCKGRKRNFMHLWVKPAFLVQTQLETITINTSLLIKNSSFRTLAFQEEDNFGASREFLSSP